ncbi:Thiamine-monophosphate kinase [invertebrate metagenome]|uniref:Thiamine-monophosphate kinase n=1 Tax=invertebrate metagenome TaxID=1711999 RepID=A0A484H749_9ZZZZ
MRRRSEFELIETLFVPLTMGFPGALGLKDDAALLNPPTGYSVVMTADAMVAGVHFRPDDPPDLIACKLVRVNLSDLAAMGAHPWVMLATLAFPDSADENWIHQFATGLGNDGQQFGIPLIGGDTIATPGPATFSLTACGLVSQGQALRRSGARPGDILYVTGTIGDGALGLQTLSGQLSFSDDESELAGYLISRYHLPQPRLIVGAGLVGMATACLDVSDGLLQALSLLCQESGVGARMTVEQLPLSPAAVAAVRQAPNWLETIVTGGDDYELLFTAPPSTQKALEQLAWTAATAITAVGTIIAGGEVVVLSPAGETVPFPRLGYQHFQVSGVQRGG